MKHWLKRSDKYKLIQNMEAYKPEQIVKIPGKARALQPGFELCVMPIKVHKLSQALNMNSE